ncbi:hypothetical protein Tco_0807421 [Tanacetum coccineum]
MTTSNDGFNGVACGKTYDIEHLKKSLHLRTTRSHVGEGDKANIYNNSHVLRLKASISGPLNKHTVKGIKPISIPRPTTSLMIPLNQLVTFRVKLKARRSRSSVLYDLGSGGPMHKFGPKSYFVPSKRLLLRSSQPLLINLKGQIVNGKQACRKSGYSFVPAQSTQRHIIREHLERTSPKEKNSSSRVAGTTEKSANDYDCMSSTIREIASKLLI